VVPRELAQAPVLVRGERAAADVAEGRVVIEVRGFAAPPDREVAVERDRRVQVIDQVVVLVQQQR
jgi:hypothetical protein